MLKSFWLGEELAFLEKKMKKNDKKHLKRFLLKKNAHIKKNVFFHNTNCHYV